MTLRLSALALVALAFGCSARPAARDASPAAPPAAAGGPHVSLDAAWFGQLDLDDLRVLERHLESSPRWEVRQEKRIWAKKLVRYAVRLEPVKPSASEGAEPPLELIPGGYRTTLNGFYSDFEAPHVLQRRVIVGLGNEFGLGRVAKATHAPATGGDALVDVWRSELPTAVESYLVVDGAQGWTIEVFEQSRTERREFTPKAVAEVLAELQTALRAREEIQANGFSAALLRDTPLRQGAPVLEVAEDSQPGIYRLSAFANPGEPGLAFARAVFVGPDPKAGAAGLPDELRGVKEGALLSTEQVEQRSLRWMGYSRKGEALFPYQSQVTVYEGDWHHLQRVRFELWFRPANGGQERKLVETTATIAGWER